MLGIDYDEYLSWDGQRERMAEADRPQAERDAGVWALDKLQSCLGDSWMTRLGKKNPAAVDRLLLASWHAVAYAELLDLALRLDLLEGVSGTASVLKDFRWDLTEDRRLHTRVVLEVAALGLQHERQVALEQSVAPGLRPTDIVLDGPSGPRVVEAVVISAAEVMREGMNYSDALSGGLRRICQAHGVEVDGSLDEILGPKQTAEWLGRVEALAQQVGGDGRERALGSEAGSLVVVPIGSRQASFKGPVIEGQGFGRIARKIADKAVQASEARANWLRVDVLDGLWQFTPWSTYPLATKGRALAPELRTALTAAEGLHGVVLTTGPAQAQGLFGGESAALPDGGYALRRCFGARVRETLIVPLGSDFEAEARSWMALYDAEPEWLPWALNRVGLESVEG